MKWIALIPGFLLLAGAVFGEKLPGSITHEVLSSGEHRYTIRGCYIHHDRYATTVTDRYWRDVPGCTRVTLEPVSGTLFFRTKAAVANLRELLERFSRRDGIIPPWEELEIRDLKSPSFDSELYTTVLRTRLTWRVNVMSSPGLLCATNSPAGLRLTFHSNGGDPDGEVSLRDYELAFANSSYTLKQLSGSRLASWKALRRKGLGTHHMRLECPITYAPGMRGRVALNDISHPGCCPGRYAMRVFDADGKYIWEDQENAAGACYLVSADLTGDGIDEIVLYQYCHNETDLLVFEKKGKRGKAER
ncbi:MAG: hypothetical protein JXR37_29740 [Kiritimatiellae bacterium]|nr:hypothetical protein [Kiritimatiellia bacterium]